jgi:8-amino-7-oxononanoate synthase
VTSSGTLANFAVSEVLAPEVSRALLDSRAHSSLVQSTRVAQLSSAVYEHLDVGDFSANCEAGTGKVLALTDGVFAASGDCAPVAELLGALSGGVLLLDDSHGLGVLGVNGRGTAGAAVATAGAESKLIVTASLAKAIGCAGGVVAGSAALIARIRESASYKGATPIAPALAKAACVAVAIAQGDDERRVRLQLNVRAVRSVFDELDLPNNVAETPIFTLVPPDPAALGALQRAAAQAGMWLPLIDYPGGPAPQYPRIAVNVEHDLQDIERLADVLHLGLRNASQKPV